MSLLVLTDDDVARITASFTPHVLMSLMALVFVRSSERARSRETDDREANDVETPLRTAADAEQYTALFMPARINGMATSVKVVSIPKTPRDSGLPASTLVLDEQSGAVKAVINAKALTALRTAAGSALATKLVGPAHPHVLIAFGAGKQIEAHAMLLLKMFPSLRDCVIVNRTPSKRLKSLSVSLQEQFPNVNVWSGCAIDTVGQDGFDLKHTVLRADIICTATSATKPLFKSSWVKVGTHVNLVGSYKPEMKEVEDELIRRAGKILVDSREACLVEAGELISAGITSEEMVEVGELVETDGEAIHDHVISVKSTGDVTIFKSVGIGLQDTAIAHLVVESAHSTGVGSSIKYDSA